MGNIFFFFRTFLLSVLHVRVRTCTHSKKKKEKNERKEDIASIHLDVCFFLVRGLKAFLLFLFFWFICFTNHVLLWFSMFF